MPNRIIRAVTLVTSCSLFLVTTVVAQEKSAPKVLERTTTSAEAKAALTTALEEVTNIGGGRRFDTKLQAVVAADPNFGLGRAWYANWTSTFTPAQRTEELTRAVKDAANGTTAELLFATALRESRAGRNPVARQLLDIVLQLAPDDPDVLWARLLIAADDAEALRIGEDGIKRFPRYAPIYNIHAYQLQAAGRTDDALRAVSKYVELAPNHPNPHDSYAEILQMIGRYDQADAHYVQALAADPTFDEAHVGRAEIEVMRGRYAAARPHLAKALTTAATPARKQVLQRQVAATFLYEGKLKDARALTTSIVTEGEANSLNVLPDKRTLAFIAAIDGRTAEAAELYTAGTPPTPFPTLPLVDAVFHALLKHPDEVSRAVAAMETNAAAAPNNVDVQGAAQAVRVIDAVVRNDIAAARAAHQRVTGPSYRALSGAFMTGAARQAGDKTLAQTALLDVEAYKAINANAAFARLIAKRK